MAGRWAGGLLCALASIGVQATPTVTYYHNDLLGSPVVATNASGQVIWRESYRPYGERLTNAPASQANDVWFTSRRQDVDTGLVYMGARYYDPVLGRFMSRDPVGFDDKNLHSFNRYAYANNNPYKYTDPDGRNAARALLAVGEVSFSIATRLGAREVGERLGLALWVILANSDSVESPGAKEPDPSSSGDDNEAKPKWATNPKHHPNSDNPEPKDAEELFGESVADDKGRRWAKGKDGELHRFSKPRNGESHWNGSTGDKIPIESQNIPVEIKRELGFKR